MWSGFSAVLSVGAPKSSFDHMADEAKAQGFFVELTTLGAVEKSKLDGNVGPICACGEPRAEGHSPRCGGRRDYGVIRLDRPDARRFEVSVDRDLEKASREALRWLRTVAA